MTECNECYGSGTYEVGPECSMPSSMCCGGCYRTVECDKCNGTGKILNQQENESDSSRMVG
jgi:hypothetical protein